MYNKLIYARMDAIEAQIRALENEYHSLYCLMVGDKEKMDQINNVINQKEETRICKSCAKVLPIVEFYSKRDLSKVYFGHKCRKCTQKERNAITKKYVAEDSKKKKDKINTFEEIARLQKEAQEKGMSYGKYVALLEMQKQKTN